MSFAHWRICSVISPVAVGVGSVAGVGRVLGLSCSISATIFGGASTIAAPLSVYLPFWVVLPDAINAAPSPNNSIPAHGTRVFLNVVLVGNVYIRCLPLLGVVSQYVVGSSPNWVIFVVPSWWPPLDVSMSITT